MAHSFFHARSSGSRVVFRVPLGGEESDFCRTFSATAEVESGARTVQPFHGLRKGHDREQLARHNPATSRHRSMCRRPKRTVRVTLPNYMSRIRADLITSG